MDRSSHRGREALEEAPASGRSGPGSGVFGAVVDSLVDLPASP